MSASPLATEVKATLLSRREVPKPVVSRCNKGAARAGLVSNFHLDDLRAMGFNKLRMESECPAVTDCGLSAPVAISF